MAAFPIPRSLHLDIPGHVACLLARVLKPLTPARSDLGFFEESVGTGVPTNPKEGYCGSDVITISRMGAVEKVGESSELERRLSDQRKKCAL